MSNPIRARKNSTTIIPISIIGIFYMSLTVGDEPCAHPIVCKAYERHAAHPPFL